MRTFIHRPCLARCAAVVLAAAAVLGLVGAAGATAGDELTLRSFLFGAERPSTAAAPPRRRHARRIWAASRSRPLRIAVGRTKRRARHVAAVRRRSVARRSPAAAPPARLVALPKVALPKIALPKAGAPAVVSIFEDRTLRTGDAVMMGDGIHIFRASDAWPHRRADFVRLAFDTTLAWQFRRTFDDLDRNPPSRWAMIDARG